MPVNLENSAVAAELENLRFLSDLATESSNSRITVLISQVSNLMLKNLRARSTINEPSGSR